MEGTPEELQKAGVKALQSKDYGTAIELLKRSVYADAGPASSVKDGWYDLGLAYAGANNHADAIAAFRREIELDPNHKHANVDLALELQQTGKTEDAIAAYRRQLEIAPYEKTTLTHLGLLLAQLGRDADARTELEAAVALPPDDPETKLALAQVYGRLGEKTKAQGLMKELTGSVSGDAGQDIFAAALRSDIDPTQTENDAQQVLYDIGGQFDSGEFDRLGPSAFSSMQLVALAWARIGWAKFLRGENLAAMQFLQSAWLLSQSGAVADRLGQVLEKQGQAEKARLMYALAIAANEGAKAGASAKDDDVRDSPERLAKLAARRCGGGKRNLAGAGRAGAGAHRKTWIDHDQDSFGMVQPGVRQLAAAGASGVCERRGEPAFSGRATAREEFSCAISGRVVGEDNSPRTVELRRVGMRH